MPRKRSRSWRSERSGATVDELRTIYVADGAAVTALLLRAGGESMGWRLARGLINSGNAKKMRTAGGIVGALMMTANGRTIVRNSEL